MIKKLKKRSGKEARERDTTRKKSELGRKSRERDTTNRTVHFPFKNYCMW